MFQILVEAFAAAEHFHVFPELFAEHSDALDGFL